MRRGGHNIMIYINNNKNSNNMMLCATRPAVGSRSRFIIIVLIIPGGDRQRRSAKITETHNVLFILITPRREHRPLKRCTSTSPKPE